MAANTTLSNAAAIAACDAIVDLIDGGSGAGKLRIYDGSQPANPDVAVSTQTLLAEIELNDPAFGSAADGTPGGVATADVDPALTDSSANDTGTAAWFRVVDSDNTAIIDGSVGTSDADLILNTTSIVAGAAVTISSWTFTVPES
jgi:hypothetical protein